LLRRFSSRNDDRACIPEPGLNEPARNGEFVEPDQGDLGRPVLAQKIFPFSSGPNHIHIFRIPAQHRGAFRDRHERRAGDAMDAGCAVDESVSCGR
jgi:hypothetical protein